MVDDTSVSTPPMRKKPVLGLWIWQWIMAGFIASLALGPTMELEKLNLPGAPSQEIYWAIAASFLLIAIFHIPQLFFRLPSKIQWVSYGLFIIAIFALGQYNQAVQLAYKKTPAGAKEVAEGIARMEADAAADQKARELEEAAERKTRLAHEKAERKEQAAQDRAERLSKLEGCLSWRGRFGPLERNIKDSLHNPHAFEHVKTEIIGPTPDGDNLEIRFRGENAFGALREGWTRAKVNPDTCELEAVGTLNVYD